MISFSGLYARKKRMINQSNQKKIMKGSKNIARLSLINIIINLVNIATSVAQAKIFGITRYIECFFAASLLSRVIVSLTQTGQVVEFVIPKYIKLRNNNEHERACNLFSGVINNQIIFGIILTVVCIVANKYIIQLLVPGFTDADKQLTTTIFYILLPTIIINLTIGVLTSFLNAEGVYGRNEMIQFSAGLLYLAIVLLSHKWLGIMSLVYALLLSQIFAIGSELYLLFTRSNLRYKFILFSEDFSLKDFVAIMKITIYYASSVQILNFAVNSSLSYQPQGVFAIYRYVESIFSKLSGILLRPISTVFFTNVNGEKDDQKVIEYIKEAVSLNMIISISVFIISFAANFYFLRVLWEGHKFPVAYIIKAKWLLDVYMFTLIVLGYNVIYRKISISFASSSKLFTTWSVVQVISAIFAYFLIRYVNYGGIIIFTLWHAIVMTAVPVYTVYRHKKELVNVFTVNKFVRYCILLIIGLAFALLINVIFFNYTIKISAKPALILLTLSYALLSSICVYLITKVLKLNDNVLSRNIDKIFQNVKLKFK
jgi:putative peptidoglycan lipid II flippase